jgi:hypothetical protein
MNINQEHPEYAANRPVWKKYRDLYVGGEEFRKHAAEHLVRRNKEPNDVYYERLSRVFYENYIGSIIDWFGATLMTREPVLEFRGTNERGVEFFDTFVRNCDLRGTSAPEFFRRRLSETLVYGKTYMALDFPRIAGPAISRADEDASGKSRAYLTEYSPEDVINWSYDSSGELEWIVIRTSQLSSISPAQDTLGLSSAADWGQETRWLYYDRESYRIYRSETGRDHSAKRPVLVDEGPHGLASQRRVPVFTMQVSEGLWLMNKAALVQLEHFNKSNALSWALTMGLFATPVIYSDREWNQIVGESYYIQLGPGDRFGWTEPEGHVYQIASENLDRLKDEIYRVCYVMNQAGGSTGVALQSGISKQLDFGVTREILRAYGDVVKASMRQVFEAINLARQDGLSIDVSGLDEFDIGDFSTELDDAKKLLDLGINSATFKAQLLKRVALKYLCDVRQDVKTQIASEIDASLAPNA